MKRKRGRLSLRPALTSNRPRKGAAQLKPGDGLHGLWPGAANRPRKGAAQLKLYQIDGNPLAGNALTAPERGRHN